MISHRLGGCRICRHPNGNLAPFPYVANLSGWRKLFGDYDGITHLAWALVLDIFAPEHVQTLAAWPWQASFFCAVAGKRRWAWNAVVDQYAAGIWRVALPEPAGSPLFI